MLCIESDYDDGEGAFHYLFCFRPWGIGWDDLSGEDSFLRPACYEEYEPMFAAGQDVPHNFAP